ARTEVDRFVADAQFAGLDVNRLVHAHTRLMAIATRESDAYAEHLHRGIGLYVLALQNAPTDEAAAESLFCKAAGELTLALRAKPDAARAHWYLHLVWTRLG